MDSGHTYDLNKSVIIENAPDQLSLAASGRDDDGWLGTLLFAEDAPPIDGPEDTKYPNVEDVNGSKAEFDLEKYPGANVSVPFKLLSMPHGDLRFVVYGHFEITRFIP
jgi:hypothetical protein